MQALKLIALLVILCAATVYEAEAQYYGWGGYGGYGYGGYGYGFGGYYPYASYAGYYGYPYYYGKRSAGFGDATIENGANNKA